MSLITKMLTQSAVYWSKDLIKLDAFGQPRHASPAVIECRWEDTNEEIITADGTKVISRARVYVGQDVSLGGFLFLGAVQDLQFPNDPRKNENTFEIIRFEKLPNMKATEVLRTAYL
jgi:hypothetical protein